MTTLFLPDKRHAVQVPPLCSVSDSIIRREESGSQPFCSSMVLQGQFFSYCHESVSLLQHDPRKTVRDVRTKFKNSRTLLGFYAASTCDTGLCVLYPAAPPCCRCGRGAPGASRGCSPV